MSTPHVQTSSSPAPTPSRSLVQLVNEDWEANAKIFAELRQRISQLEQQSLSSVELKERIDQLQKDLIILRGQAMIPPFADQRRSRNPFFAEQVTAPLPTSTSSRQLSHVNQSFDRHRSDMGESRSFDRAMPASSRGDSPAPAEDYTRFGEITSGQRSGSLEGPRESFRHGHSPIGTAAMAEGRFQPRTSKWELFHDREGSSAHQSPAITPTHSFTTSEFASDGRRIQDRSQGSSRLGLRHTSHAESMPRSSRGWEVYDDQRSSSYASHQPTGSHAEDSHDESAPYSLR